MNQKWNAMKQKENAIKYSGKGPPAAAFATAYLADPLALRCGVDFVTTHAMGGITEISGRECGL